VKLLKITIYLLIFDCILVQKFKFLVKTDVENIEESSDR